MSTKIENLRKPDMQSKFFQSRCTCKISREVMVDECIKSAKLALEALGHGHTERAYEDVMVNYFYKQRIPYMRQTQYYQKVDGQIIPVGVADIEVDHSVILELKANVKEITDDHRTQLLRYLRAANARQPHEYRGAVILFAKDGKLRVWLAQNAPRPALTDKK